MGQLTCSECGAGLVNLANGQNSVCPNGHVGLFPPVSAEDNRKHVRESKVALLPQAEVLTTVIAITKGDAYADKQIYICEGKVYRRKKRQSASLTSHAERTVLAKVVDASDSGRVVELVEWTALSEATRLFVGKFLDMLKSSWGLVANSYGGDWESATKEWKDAATRWRDKYHELIQVDIPNAPSSETTDEQQAAESGD